MVQIARSDKAFTLLEVMVSMVIMFIVFLALLAAMSVYTKQNVANVIGDEAIKIAQECVERLRNGQMCPAFITRDFRGISITFTVNSPNPATFASGNNDVTITVSYNYANKTHQYQLNTVIYK